MASLDAELGQKTHSILTAEEPLLFINRYSEDPLGRRRETNRSAIGKHVQYVIRRKKKHDAKMSLNTRGFREEGLIWRTKKARGDRFVSSATQHVTSSSRPAAPDQSCSDTAKTQLRAKSHSQARSDLQSWWNTKGQGLLHSGIKGHGPLSDILMSLPQAQAMVAPPALAFYMLTFLPRVYPVPSQAEAHRQWIIQRLVTSPVICLSMIASGAAGVQALPGESHWKKLISPAAAKSLEVAAIRQLRSSLASAEVLDPSFLIYSVMCLVVTQIVNGDMDAIQAHGSALSHLIRLREALRGMPMYVVEGFYSTCYISSMITGQPPIPPPVYHTEMTGAEAHLVLLRITASHPHLADLGQAFFDSSVEAALGPKYIQLLLDMRAVVLWREYYHNKEQNCSDAEFAYFQNLSRNTRFLALSLRCAVAVETEESILKRTTIDIPLSTRYGAVDDRRVQGALQEPCRIALLSFWNAYNQVSRPGSLLYRTLATQLERALKTSLTKSTLLGYAQLCRLVDEQSKGVLLWILLLGALMTQGEDNQSEFFFLRSIAEYRQTFSSEDRLHGWPEARNVLKRVLYLERVFGKSMEGCYERAARMGDQRS